MNTRDWVLLGWVWVVGLTFLGLAILTAPLFNLTITNQFDAGQGTSLLLVAASILFAAVLPTLAATGNKLVSVAGVLTAIFGYSGTLIILSNEDPILLAIVFAYTIYLAFIALVLVIISIIIRRIFTRMGR